MHLSPLRHSCRLFWLLLLFAAAAPAAATSPEQVLQEVTEQMIMRLSEERQAVHERPQRLFELVDEVLVPHVDVPRISRWVLGKYWRQSTDAQRTRFMEAFRTLLVRFYTAALLDDPSQLDGLLARADRLITFQRTQFDDKGENALVRSEVYLDSGATIPVHFRMHRDGDDWKVYDVNVEGISLVTTYRSSFAQEIRQVGLDGLIDRLVERNEDLLNQVQQDSEVRTAAAAE